MAGHSKWANIKHRKGRADAKRGKIFSRLSKEIIMAARLGGGDPDANTRLKTAITAAKNANYPNDNIDRSIKKGTGELEGGQLDELVYEAYGPGGVAFIIECLSDNKNRTAAEIRHVMTKSGGNLAGAGAVSFQFHRKARFVIEGDGADEDALMELFFGNDVDVEEISVEDDIAEVIAPADAFDSIHTCLETAGISAIESAIVRVPDNRTPITDQKTAEQFMRLVDAIEDNDDVQNVYENAEIPDEIAESLG